MIFLVMDVSREGGRLRAAVDTVLPGGVSHLQAANALFHLTNVKLLLQTHSNFSEAMLCVQPQGKQ